MLQLDVHVTSHPPQSQGIHPEAVAICIVQGMKEPLFLHVSAEVFGISVCYAVNEGSPERQRLQIYSPVVLKLCYMDFCPLFVASVWILDLAIL